MQNFASLNCFLNLIKNETCNFNGLNCEVSVLSGFNKKLHCQCIHSTLKAAKRQLLCGSRGKSTTLVKQKQHFLTTKFNRKIQSKNSICWCGSAVEHHLGKVGVTGPIPVTSSIYDRKILSFFIFHSGIGPRSSPCRARTVTKLLPACRPLRSLAKNLPLATFLNASPRHQLH